MPAFAQPPVTGRHSAGLPAPHRRIARALRTPSGRHRAVLGVAQRRVEPITVPLAVLLADELRATAGAR